jgi:tetratricopeptide (TPR) repeat protein
MGFRFQRRIKIAPGVRLNLSKSGLGLSAGPRGASVSVGPSGAHAHLGVPGTGLSYRTKLDKRLRTQRTATPAVSAAAAEADSLPAPRSTWIGWVILFALMGFAAPACFAVAGLVFVASRWVQTPRLARQFNQARVLALQGQHVGAAQHLDRYVKGNARDLEAWRWFQDILWHQLGDQPSALAAARRCYELAPADPEIRCDLIWLLLEQGHYSEVVQAVQAAMPLADDPFGETLRLALGRALLEQGAIEPAIEQFKQGPVRSRTREDETLLAYRYWLGVAYLRVGNKRSAKTQLGKVYAQDIAYRDIEELATDLGLVAHQR